ITGLDGIGNGDPSSLQESTDGGRTFGIVETSYGLRGYSRDADGSLTILDDFGFKLLKYRNGTLVTLSNLSGNHEEIAENSSSIFLGTVYTLQEPVSPMQISTDGGATFSNTGLPHDAGPVLGVS